MYRVLYESRNDSDEHVPTMQQIRERVGGSLGDNEQLDRRRRNLNYYFVIEKVRRPRTDGRKGTDTAYRLVAPKPKLTGVDAAISERDRAFVLRQGRCAMCGRTPLGDGVKLQVDHRVPQEWGGDNSLENLQPLCEECNRGKKNLFASYDEFADQIKVAIGHEDVYLRIGELLKAFAAAGKWAPDEIIQLVAEARGPQRYWEKRKRELRHLGWILKPHLKTVERRRRTDWELVHWEPWPAEGPGRAIRRLTRKKS